jgi:hypothetical protein
MKTKQWHEKLLPAIERVKTWIRAGVFIPDPNDTHNVRIYFTTFVSTQKEWDKRMRGGCSSCNKLARLYRDVKLHIENELKKNNNI